MTDFLLELLSEEIPARMQERARGDLARLFGEEIGRAGLKAGAVETFSTPRRLALIARGLPLETEAVREELKGPRVGAPPQALEGFLRKTGLSREQLVERDGVLFAVIEKPGRAVRDVLAEAVPAIVRAFPWPKSMRWGEASISTESIRWVRPLQGIVALLGEQIVEFEVAGVKSGAATVGHRFHHPGCITIGSAGDYAEKLRVCHVIVDHEERKRIIAEGARAAAEAAGLSLVEDEGLLVENAGLTEWPVPLLGGFDPAFLEVPREVIQLTMRTNQKYFALNQSSPERGGGSRSETEGAASASHQARPAPSTAFGGPPPRSGEDSLAPAFICTANIDARDGGAAIVAGNRKVLAARLSDARFFWEQDLKVPLEDQARKLDQIVFHEKLGTVADKVERVAKLARWLVEEGIVKSSPERGGGSRSETEGAVSASHQARPAPSTAFGGPPPRSGEDLASLAETAGRLCKADLVTGMVGEFPELQGVMGGYYARAQGYPAEVADAIRDHYKPVGQGDEVPTAPVTVAVSLADKLDNVIAFFAANELPTGSKDPQALRRAALSVAALISHNRLSLGLSDVIELIYKELFDQARVSLFPVQIRDQWTYFVTLKEAGEIDLTLPMFFFDVPSYADNFVPPDSEHEAIARSEGYLESFNKTHGRVLDFFADRLKVQQREAGVRHDLIDAVFALGGEDDLVRLLARVKALQAFVGTEDGANLLVGYRRAANILKKEGWSGEPLPFRGGVGVGNVDLAQTSERRAADRPHPNPSGSQPCPPDRAKSGPDPEGEGLEKSLSYTPLPEEQSLIAALDAAGPRAAAAVEAEDFEGAMTALASLRGPIDAFFDKVTVNDPDPPKREARLNLLARIRDAVHQVADFSRIEG